MIAELTDFLRFIREMTHNYRYNGHKMHRNNSISIIYLLCKLITFKYSNEDAEDENVNQQMSPRPHECTIDMDVSQKMKRLSQKSPRKIFEVLDQFDVLSNFGDESASMSTLSNYVTATEATHDNIWRKELEIAFFDYPLKHFCPQVNDLLFYALEVNIQSN